MIHRLIFLGLTLFFTGCATQTQLYYWGDYSNTLYKYKKNPDNETLAGHKASLLNIIGESNQRNTKIPPGVCCEYGYILLREGKTQEALAYFDLEEKNYPESKLFITRLKKISLKDEAGK